MMLKPPSFRRPGLLVLPLLAVLLLSACAARGPRGHVADLDALPQDLTAYLDKGSAQERMLSAEAQQDRADAFLRALFRPWSMERSSFEADVFAPYLRRARDREIFGENTLPRPAAWAAQLTRNADLDRFPNLNRPALTVAHTSLRLLPTDDPMFYDFADPGEGFPFDMAQNSAVWAGTPVFAAHLSADRDWVLVETRFAGGWMRVSDLAFPDPEVMRRMQAGPFVAVIRDRVPLADDEGMFRQRARIGQVLPLELGSLARERDADHRVLLPIRLPDGGAGLVGAPLPRTAGAHFPLPLTPLNIAAVGNDLLGEPYGWGGLFHNRDCSASMLDLFAPFGLDLPRNSKAQARAGRFLPLDGLDNDDKEQAVLRQGVPLATLVYKPGHIMLYAGEHDGRPVVLHNLWGLRSSETNGPTPGRLVIGRTVITTLTPGSERPELVRPGGLLLESVSGMTLLLNGK